MYNRVVVLKLTDVSKVRTAYIIALMIEAVRNSETSVYSNETTRAQCAQEALILILAAVATSNLINCCLH
jgi:hypothetical protein